MPESHKNENETSLIIFSKAPIPGLVKTRLTKDTIITEVDAATLAEAMLKDTLILASKSRADNIFVGYTPYREEKNILQLTKIVIASENILCNFSLLLQEGSDFDSRFYSVVEQAFNRKIKYLVIIGADLPYLDPQIINLAYKQLNSSDLRNSIVLGPAGGGGIYLLGITKNFDPRWFSELKLFSGGIEIHQFINLCKEKDFDLILLPPLTDIDLEEDLISLITFINAMKNAQKYEGYHYPKYTAEIIEKLGLNIEETPDNTRKRRIVKIIRDNDDNKCYYYHFK